MYSLTPRQTPAFSDVSERSAALRGQKGKEWKGEGGSIVRDRETDIERENKTVK